MKQIPSKIFYEVLTGTVLFITSEYKADFDEPTKEDYMSIYVELNGKDIDEVDYISMPFGELLNVTNVKSYRVNVETKQLECEYYTNSELQEMQNQKQETQELNNKISDISNYLNDQSSDTIKTFEDLILQTELNKSMEGMN